MSTLHQDGSNEADTSEVIIVMVTRSRTERRVLARRALRNISKAEDRRTRESLQLRPAMPITPNQLENHIVLRETDLTAEGCHLRIAPDPENADQLVYSVVGPNIFYRLVSDQRWLNEIATRLKFFFVVIGFSMVSSRVFKMIIEYVSFSQDLQGDFDAFALIELDRVKDLSRHRMVTPGESDGGAAEPQEINSLLTRFWTILITEGGMDDQWWITKFTTFTIYFTYAYLATTVVLVFFFFYCCCLGRVMWKRWGHLVRFAGQLYEEEWTRHI